MSLLVYQIFTGVINLEKKKGGVALTLIEMKALSNTQLIAEIERRSILLEDWDKPFIAPNDRRRKEKAADTRGGLLNCLYEAASRLKSQSKQPRHKIDPPNA